ncbi:GDSL-type esterase/lipase family protein [Sandarakinorhabdus oryzae]|uniref:GDSL-type esterase/lipase family protein n=1 Tax=Sandarakinorhabdus oryzae TaxID=2675220 RepID=UPI0018CC1AA1|nr:GDSL-type esterase/lipase family protein [Sandarakinorhabdus oryzae]
MTMRLRLGAALLALTVPGTVQAQARFQAEQPTARVDYWQKRAADIGRELATAPELKSVRLVFIGDSITDFWHLDANPWMPGRYCGKSVWDESFGGAVPAHRALNLGVSGDRIEHVLHRLLPAAEGGEGWLDRADLQPQVIFVMLGINNSFDAEAPAATSIERGITAVVARIRERKPGARIVLQSLLPTDDEAKNRDVVRPVNQALQAMAARSATMAYLDLYPDFVDAQGRQRRDLFNDGLHPSRDGYRVWRDRLLASLNQKL